MAFQGDLIRRDLQAYSFETDLEFPSEFRVAVDNDLRVKSLCLRTSAEYVGNGSIILRQSLAGIGLSRDSERGLDGVVGITYKEAPRPALERDPGMTSEQVAKTVLEKHEDVLRVITDHYLHQRPLSRKIEFLEII